MSPPPTASGSNVRSAYLAGLTGLDRILGQEAVAADWQRPSALEGMAVSSLVGHLALSALQVERFLEVVDPETHRVDAAHYYARLFDTDRPDSALNIGVVARANEVAAKGYRDVVEAVAGAGARLRVRIPNEPPDRTIGIAHRPGERMLLDEYLATRCVELAVHLDDLALTFPLDQAVPETTIRVATQVLFEAAEIRHGSQALLVALARRERDDVDALRVI